MVDIRHVRRVACFVCTRKDPSVRTAVPGLDVLVVDDAPITRKVMSRMLGRLGHRVSLAVNDIDALHHMRAKRWDVVVMDLQMPLMGGEEATRLFRADEVVHAPQPRMRIICSTANTEWCLDPALFDAVLFKPFTPQRCVQSLIGI